jgi:hypothetical protein
MTVDELVEVLRRIRSAVESNDPEVYDPIETLRDIHRVADEAICKTQEVKVRG